MLQKGEYQWRRDGGPSLRERDIGDLRPQGEPRVDGDSLIYRLDENRQITVRPSTTFRDTPFPTMDVQRRIVLPDGREKWPTIHKIRYRLAD